MPFIKKDGWLYNVGFLCRRDGSVEMYEKIHVTPDEQKFWGLSQGSQVKTFDTDCGRIGILICYDVEFPELSRLMADQGMQILFVPFNTDTQNAYNRVRICAQARAIENQALTLGVNRTGTDPACTYPGCSAAFDAYGRTLCSLDNKAQARLLCIDLSRQHHLRQVFPVLR